MCVSACAHARRWAGEGEREGERVGRESRRAALLTSPRARHPCLPPHLTVLGVLIWRCNVLATVALQDRAANAPATPQPSLGSPLPASRGLGTGNDSVPSTPSTPAGKGLEWSAGGSEDGRGGGWEQVGGQGSNQASKIERQDSLFPVAGEQEAAVGERKDEGAIKATEPLLWEALGGEHSLLAVAMAMITANMMPEGGGRGAGGESDSSRAGESGAAGGVRSTAAGACLLLVSFLVVVCGGGEARRRLPGCCCCCCCCCCRRRRR